MLVWVGCPRVFWSGLGGFPSVVGGGVVLWSALGSIRGWGGTQGRWRFEGDRFGVGLFCEVNNLLFDVGSDVFREGFRISEEGVESVGKLGSKVW